MKELVVAASLDASAAGRGEPLPESLRQVLESRTFERSPTLRVLLAYLWQNRDAPIGEYAIATEALGRSPSFDAKTDATVRVQISRLRQRLEKFYSDEGKGLPGRVVVPMGAHKVRIESATAPENLPEVLTDPIAISASQLSISGNQPRRVNRFLLAACIALAAISGGLGIALYRVSTTTTQKSLDQAPRFWRSFFGPRRQTRILLPTPVFFSYGRGLSNTVMFRDTSINEFADAGQSNLIKYMNTRLGGPQLAQNYTVTSDTFASVSLVRYLDQFSLPTRVRSSADGPMEALDTENVIALGTWGTLAPLKLHQDKMDFRLSAHESWVDVRHPAAGEPAQITQVVESAERSTWPGVVAVLPGHRGRDGTTHLLILASRHTSALVATLTSGVGLEQIERLWRSKGSPEFFEMVVNCEMDGMQMVRSWPVLLHPFHGEETGNTK